MFSEHVCIVIHLRLKEVQHGGEELPLSIQLWCSGSTCSVSHPLMTPHVFSQVLRATDTNMSECMQKSIYLLLCMHKDTSICIVTQTTMPHF